MKQFSVVTVILNDACGFNKTARSLIDQTSCDWEWVVIDGASDDKTLRQIDEFSKKIDYFVSERDNGIYHAMNKGINACNGKYIIFLNAGDILADSRCLEIIDGCIQAEEPVDVILGGTLQNFDGMMLYRSPKNMSWIRKGLPAFHQSTIYRLELLKKRNYNLNYKLLADYEYLAHLCLSGVSALYIDRPISIFSVGGASYKQFFLKFHELFDIKKNVLKLPFITAYFSSLFRIVNSLIAFAVNKYMKYFKFENDIDNKVIEKDFLIKKEFYSYNKED